MIPAKPGETGRRARQRHSTPSARLSTTDDERLIELWGALDVETYPILDYPPVGDILMTLNLAKTRGHVRDLKRRLQRGGWDTLDDITMVSPSGLYVFTGIPVWSILEIFEAGAKALRQFHEEKKEQIDEYQCLLREGNFDLLAITRFTELCSLRSQ